MSTALKPLGKATYVATTLEREWLQIEQRKLYARSSDDRSYVFRKLWGLITDPRNLSVAFAGIAANRGKRTAGVDRITVRQIMARGADAFLVGLRSELRMGGYRPSPVRRVLIPKPGQPGKFRPLGIPTVKDRVGQAAVKNILEPIFEADFFPSSFGFRPGKSVHGALEPLRMHLRPKQIHRKPSAKDVGCAGAEFVVSGYERAGVAVERVARQQRLNFLPEPHGQGSLRVGRALRCRNVRGGCRRRRDGGRGALRRRGSVGVLQSRASDFVKT
jgi:hypothetical protein